MLCHHINTIPICVDLFDEKTGWSAKIDGTGTIYDENR